MAFMLAFLVVLASVACGDKVGAQLVAELQQEGQCPTAEVSIDGKVLQKTLHSNNATTDHPTPGTSSRVKEVRDAECPVEHWINQNVKQPGYHVLCRNGREFRVWSESYSEAPVVTFTSYATNYAEYRSEVERHVGLKYTDAHRRADIYSNGGRASEWRLQWNMYVTDGDIIQAWDHITSDNIFLLFESGIWVWPAIREGFERQVTSDNKQYTLTTLALDPVIISVPGLITQEEREYIVKVAKETGMMQESSVSHMKDTSGSAKQWRTSSNAWLNDKLHHPIQRINRRISLLSRTPVSHSEPVQVLRYRAGEKYDSHWDYFDPAQYEGTPTARDIAGDRNRMLTVFWYITTVMKGGETYFPQYNGRRTTSYTIMSPEDCDKGGLKSPARAGSVVMFYSMKTDGSWDPNSLHAACPPGEGEVKWAANKWIWNVPWSGSSHSGT